MGDSLLQKEFKDRDLTRIRNLIKKDFTSAVGGQVGYTKVHEERKEGDIWDERGKTWTIKNGIKMTVSKLDAVKKALQLPLVCPDCQKTMKKGALDKKMFFIHQKCFDCVVEFETKLRQEGKYEEYERQIMNNNIYSYINELEQVFQEYLLNTSTEGIVTEDGDIEQWVGGNIDKIKETEQFKEYVNKLKKLASEK